MKASGGDDDKDKEVAVEDAEKVGEVEAGVDLDDHEVVVDPAASIVLLQSTVITRCGQIIRIVRIFYYTNFCTEKMVKIRTIFLRI